MLPVIVNPLPYNVVKSIIISTWATDTVIVDETRNETPELAFGAKEGTLDTSSEGTCRSVGGSDVVIAGDGALDVLRDGLPDGRFVSITTPVGVSVTTA